MQNMTLTQLFSKTIKQACWDLVGLNFGGRTKCSTKDLMYSPVTVTVNVHESWFEELSVAVTVTVVGPRGKIELGPRGL